MIKMEAMVPAECLLIMVLATKLDCLSDLWTNMTEGENHLSKVTILWSTFAPPPILINTCNKVNEEKLLDNKLEAEAYPQKGSSTLRVKCGKVTVVSAQGGTQMPSAWQGFQS